MDTFFLNNVIKVKTCYKSASGTIFDIVLTNKMRNLQKTSTVATSMLLLLLRLPQNDCYLYKSTL